MQRIKRSDIFNWTLTNINNRTMLSNYLAAFVVLCAKNFHIEKLPFYFDPKSNLIVTPNVIWVLETGFLSAR